MVDIYKKCCKIKKWCCIIENDILEFHLGTDYPYCQSHKVVKNGHRQGKQSYLCRECGRQFRDGPCPAGYSSDVKELCVKMSLNA